MTSENAEVYPGNAAYPNPTFPPNQPPQPAYPGYPPTAPGMTAYDPTKQPMGPGVPAGWLINIHACTSVLYFHSPGKLHLKKL